MDQSNWNSGLGGTHSPCSIESVFHAEIIEALNDTEDREAHSTWARSNSTSARSSWFMMVDYGQSTVLASPLSLVRIHTCLPYADVCLTNRPLGQFCHASELIWAGQSRPSLSHGSVVWLIPVFTNKAVPSASLYRGYCLHCVHYK